MRKKEISDMITHIRREERELLERILPIIGDQPMGVMGSAITILFAFSFIAAHQAHPEGDVNKLFDSSVKNARGILDAYLAGEADRTAKPN